MSIIDKVEVDGTIYDIFGGGILPHLVISTDSGLTVTVTKGTTTITATETSEGIYECDVTEFGTYSISDTENTKDVVIDTVTIYQLSMTPPVPEGATVTPTDDIETWIKCAGLENTNNYTSLAEVMADTELFDTLLRDSNACDYMARSTTWAKAEGLVPVMTSNTTPSGTAFSNSERQAAYKAFDGDDTSYAANQANVFPYYLGYSFPTATVVNKAYIKPFIAENNKPMVKDFKIQGSNDGFISDTHDLYEGSFSESETEKTITFANSTAYMTYRLNISSTYYSQGYSSVYTVQFYTADITTNRDAMARIGKYDYCADKLLSNATWAEAIAESEYFEEILDVKVPVMTGATSPSGEVSASGYYGSYYPYYAFDGNDSSYWWGGNGVIASWIQYHFTEPVKIYCVKYIVYDNDPIGKRSTTCKIQASNDGGATLVDVTETITNTTTGEMNVMLTKNLGNYSDYRWQNVSSSYEPVLSTLQFYGRHSSVQYSPLVPIMTSDTTPSGECICDAASSGHEAYKAFDDDWTTSSWSSTYYDVGSWVGYHFTQPVVVKKVKVYSSFMTYKIQGSNDGSTWTDLDENEYGYVSTQSAYYGYSEEVIDNDTAYSYIRLLKTGQTTNYASVVGIQFYTKILSTTQIHSCPNDTLYITDGVDTEILCTTDSNGIGSIDWSEFDAGTYGIYSSIAKDLNNLNHDYHKAVRVTNTQYGHTTDAYIMPDGALYWYGYENALFSGIVMTNYRASSAGGQQVTSTITRNTNDVQIAVTGSATSSQGSAIINNVPLASASSLSVIGSCPKPGTYSGVSLNVASTATISADHYTVALSESLDTTTSTKTINVSSISTDRAISFFGTYTTATIKALWLG